MLILHIYVVLMEEEFLSDCGPVCSGYLNIQSLHCPAMNSDGTSKYIYLFISP